MPLTLLILRAQGFKTVYMVQHVCRQCSYVSSKGRPTDCTFLSAAAYSYKTYCKAVDNYSKLFSPNLLSGLLVRLCLTSVMYCRPKYFLPSHVAAHLCHHVTTATATGAATATATGKVGRARKDESAGEREQGQAFRLLPENQ